MVGTGLATSLYCYYKVYATLRRISREIEDRKKARKASLGGAEASKMEEKSEETKAVEKQALALFML